MDEPLEERYFNWLCAKVVRDLGPHPKGLLQKLHSMEYTWIVSGDRNRAAEGVELREYFFNSAFIKRDPEFLRDPCSLLEFFIAFADRAAFQTSEPTHKWFWEFMTNLNLEGFRVVSRETEQLIDDILYTFLWRVYEDNGDGGMFPLRNPRRDQRRMEIWYQFCDYLEDQGFL